MKYIGCSTQSLIADTSSIHFHSLRTAFCICALRISQTLSGMAAQNSMNLHEGLPPGWQSGIRFQLIDACSMHFCKPTNSASLLWLSSRPVAAESSAPGRKETGLDAGFRGSYSFPPARNLGLVRNAQTSATAYPNTRAARTCCAGNARDSAGSSSDRNRSCEAEPHRPTSNTH